MGIASEEKILSYLKQMFPGYAFYKTGGNGVPDYMGAPPTDSELPTIFVESKQKTDRLRESQKGFAESEVGIRYRKYICYTPSIDAVQCFMYTWDDWLLFVEQEDCVARIARKESEEETLGTPFAQQLRDLLMQPNIQALVADVSKLKPHYVNADETELNGPYYRSGKVAAGKHEHLGVYWACLCMSGSEIKRLMEDIKELGETRPFSSIDYKALPKE